MASKSRARAQLQPRDFLAWTVAVTCAVLLAMFAYFLFMDLQYANFPRLEALLGIESPIIQALIVAAAAAVPATLLVLLLQASKGALEYSVLGVQVKGSSGPILLWVVAFLSVAAVLLIALRIVEVP
jgi:hypothetical protein